MTHCNLHRAWPLLGRYVTFPTPSQRSTGKRSRPRVWRRQGSPAQRAGSQHQAASGPMKLVAFGSHGFFGSLVFSSAGGVFSSIDDPNA